MPALTILFVAIILGIFGQILMKKGMMNTGQISVKELISRKFLSVVFEKFVFSGIFLYVLSSVFWLVVLSQEELSFAYPLVAVGYIFTAILSKIFFKENLTMLRIFGIILITAGAYLLVATY